MKRIKFSDGVGIGDIGLGLISLGLGSLLCSVICHLS
jgi:hypothetical protein